MKLKKNFTFRLPDELAFELHRVAAACGENASAIGRRGVERELQSMKRREQRRQVRAANTRNNSEAVSR